MADSERQGVRAVGRAWRVGEPEQPRHHLSHLSLARPAGTRDCGLDLARGMERDRQAAPRGTGDGDGTCLRRAHDGPHVVLAEDALDCHRVRLMQADPAIENRLQGKQPRADAVTCRGPDHVGADKPQGPTRLALNNPDTAASQTRVDAEYAHSSPSRSCNPLRTPVRHTTAGPPRPRNGAPADDGEKDGPVPFSDGRWRLPHHSSIRKARPRKADSSASSADASPPATRPARRSGPMADPANSAAKPRAPSRSSPAVPPPARCRLP